MICIAITGGIACGKSTVAALLPEWGGVVLDTDAVTHELEAAGGAAVAPIEAAFGPGVIGPDGGVDRAALGRLVFGHDAALRKLNAVVHPLVRLEVDRWLAVPVAGVRFKAVVVPLLFEAGWHGRPWDAVVAVVCTEATQLRRLAQRGLDETLARRRVALQMSCEEKAARADHVIRNDADRTALRAETERVIRAVLEREP